MRPRRPFPSTPLAVAALSAALVALAAGCTRNPNSPAAWAAALSASEARWHAAALQNYTYGIVRTCYCTADQLRSVRVTVRGGVLSSIVYTDSVGGAADTTLFRQYLTMDRYFALLDQVMAAGPADFRASFSSSLGYPAYVQVDPVASVLDDEFIVETFSFTVDTP